jgi:DNA helicase-2/ATP-dependent DNA helicase PcrA
MTEADAILFFRKHIHSFSLNYFRPLGNPNKFIGGMIQHFSRLKDEEISPDDYLKWVKKQQKNDAKQSDEEREEQEKYLELANAYRQYEELKIKDGVADYSDLISHTLAVFKKRPHILKQYQEQFTYILVDEFQDTNFAQNTLAVLLAGKKKNITVVGDDDQAVYRWRGAAVSNMIQFRSTFPKTTIVVLTKNYRSSKEILDRSYDLIQNNNPDRLEVAEHIDKKLESMRRVNGERSCVC